MNSLTKENKNTDTRTREIYIVFLVTILIHVLILFTLLSCLFIFVVSSITEDEFNKQVNSMTNQIVTSTLTKIDNNDNSSDSNSTINQNNSNITKQFIIDNQDTLRKLYYVYNVQDPSKITNNKWLYTCNIMFILLFLIGIMAFVAFLLLFTDYKVDIWDILKHDAVYFPCVLVIELCVFYFIALHLAPVTSLFLSQYVINRVKTNLS